MKFDKNYFTKQDFTPAELAKYERSFRHELAIAEANPEPEVKFHFAYMALIKIGIHLLAKAGYRLKSKPGHHIKLIEFLSGHFKSEEIAAVSERMRQTRNLDLYGGGFLPSKEEIKDYLDLIKRMANKF